MTTAPVRQRADYTFKYNQQLGRHGWLRLTPAYSVKLVTEIIESIPANAIILDPFSGTATTGLVAAERGLTAHGLDINRFLVWLGRAKCRNYSAAELGWLGRDAQKCLAECDNLVGEDCWTPEIHNINRWWCGQTLTNLAALRQALAHQFGEPEDGEASALAWIAFCRLVIETSSAAFNHVSLSFQEGVITYDLAQIKTLYEAILQAILASAAKGLPGQTAVYLADARALIHEPGQSYSHVITSPPYPNRISYIRELRPYMYWLKFLENGREAGELDWQAIGGTWGVATSRLHTWEANGHELPASFGDVTEKILCLDEKNAPLMAQYVAKYFHDMHQHFAALRPKLQQGAELAYIVGNSSFYGVQVRTEELLADSLRQLGYDNVGYQAIRKRNSKKELFEYYVYATWQAGRIVAPAYFSRHGRPQRQLALF
jgi:hypothetical protein